jgi:hypothetical protein
MTHNVITAARSAAEALQQGPPLGHQVVVPGFIQQVPEIIYSAGSGEIRDICTVRAKPVNTRARQQGTSVIVVDLEANYIMIAQWLSHYPTSPKVAGSRPDEVNELFQIT